MKPRIEVDPLLAHLLGDASDEPPNDDAPDCDPVGDFLHQLKYKIPAEGAKPEPTSIAEIATSLDCVRRAIGGENPFAERLRKLNFPLAKMAASAAELSGEASPVANFLKAAAEGSDEKMKAAIKALVLRGTPVQ